MNEIEYLNLRNMIEQYSDRKIKRLQNWVNLCFIAAVIFLGVCILKEPHFEGKEYHFVFIAMIFSFVRGFSFLILISKENEICFKRIIKIGNAWEDQKLTVKEVLAHEEFRGLFPLRDVDAENYVGAGHRSK